MPVIDCKMLCCRYVWKARPRCAYTDPQLGTWHLYWGSLGTTRAQPFAFRPRGVQTASPPHLPAPCCQAWPLSSCSASRIFQEARRDLPVPKDSVVHVPVLGALGQHAELRQRSSSPLRWLNPGKLVLRAQEGEEEPCVMSASQAGAGAKLRALSLLQPLPSVLLVVDICTLGCFGVQTAFPVMAGSDSMQ